PRRPASNPGRRFGTGWRDLAHPSQEEKVMSQVNVVRAWKDEEYRRDLTEAERASLPENPAGLVELPQTELQQVAGGNFQVPGTPVLYYTLMPGGCTFYNCPVIHQVQW